MALSCKLTASLLLGKFEEHAASKNWEITLDLASTSHRVDAQCGFIKWKNEESAM